MGFGVFLTAADEKALNLSSFIVKLCPYPILWVKDSCCFIEGLNVVIILFCVILCLYCPAYVLKCPGLLLSMILIVYIIPQQQLRMQCGQVRITFC